MKMLKNLSKNILYIVLGVFGVMAIIVGTNITTTKIEEVEEPIKYSTNVIYDSNIREGTKEVTQDGRNGLKRVVYEVTYKHGDEVGRKKQSEAVIEEAISREVIQGTKKYYTCTNGVEYETQEEKAECDKKVAWEKQRDNALQTCNNDTHKTNCWYDEYPGTTMHYDVIPNTSGNRTGAICKDGTRSTATGRGACSHHGGVAYWI